MAGKRVTPAKRTSTPRPKAALNKTLLLQGPKIKDGGFDSDSDQRDSPDTIVIGKHDPGIVSPKSYLSMPSVKSFPRYVANLMAILKLILFMRIFLRNLFPCVFGTS